VIIVSVEPEGSPRARVDLSDRVLSLDYEDAENRADKLDLRVDNHDLSNFDDPIWRKGNFIEVSWGYPEAMSPTRRCQIRRVKGFRELTVEAHGLEVMLNTVARTKTFEHMTRSDIVRQIAGEMGYRSDDVLHVEDTKVVFDHVHQAGMTDAQLLRRLAQKEGFEWYIDFDGFHFHKRDFAQRSKRVLRWFDDPDGSEIIDINIDNDVTAKAGTVKVAARDPLGRRTIESTASHETELLRAVLSHIVEAPGTDSPKVPGFAAIAQEFLHPTTEVNEEAVQRDASAKFRKAQQVAVKMNLTMVGDPSMLAKSVITLEGVGKRLSQDYYIRTVKTKIDSGYTCVLGMVSDGSGGHSTKSELATEASAIQVGPTVKGRHAPRAERRTLEKPGEEPRASIEGKDADGKPVRTFVDQRHRGAPPGHGSKN